MFLFVFNLLERSSIVFFVPVSQNRRTFSAGVSVAKDVLVVLMVSNSFRRN